MASLDLAEQLRLLSNPEPSSFDPELDEYDVTAAKTVEHGVEEGQEVVAVPSSALRKKTAALLGEEDVKYAGRKTSRAELLALRDNDGLPESDDQYDGTDIEGAQSSEEASKGQETSESETEDNYGDDSIVEEKAIANGRPKIDTRDDESELTDGNKMQGDDNGDDDKESEDDEYYDSDDEGDDGDGDSGVDNDDDEESEYEEEEDEEGVQQFSTKNADDDIEKGHSAKNQISLWDSFLETRIRLQKSLVLANRLPQFDNQSEFTGVGGSNLTDPLKQGNSLVKDLLRSLLLLQEKLLEQNKETKDILYGGMEKKENNKKIDSDEEIASDTEDEKEEKESEEESENSDKKRQSLRLPAKRKHNLTVEEYSQVIAKRHAAFENYRDSTIGKWSDKTRLASGKLTSKEISSSPKERAFAWLPQSFSSFDRSALVQIRKILSDKERLIKRTQLKRSTFRVLGKPEQQTSSESGPETLQEQTDTHLKDYDPEIFDDDDFYHQLLRELIERRTNVNSDDPMAMGRQWLELQKLRRKVKRKIDTRASKGRKIRYNIHAKLVNFMAPIQTGSSTDAYRNELFSSLFGQQQTRETGSSDITIMR